MNTENDYISASNLKVGDVFTFNKYTPGVPSNMIDLIYKCRIVIAEREGGLAISNNLDEISIYKEDDVTIFSNPAIFEEWE